MKRQNRDKIRNSAFVLLLTASVILCACSGQESSGGDGAAASGPPEKHFIEYDASMDTVGDALGADSFDNLLDDDSSRYYKVNDYYNMKSGKGLHIIPEFETYQQTTEYSCGPAAAIMVMNHYGNNDYNELEICRLTGTNEDTGTSVEGLAGFFKDMGWNVEVNASTKEKFGDIGEAEKFFADKIDAGIPVLVNWEDWAGHWQAVIGIDTCSEISPYDDVLIMADPYDVTDHYQDGYNIVPFGRFYSNMWREGPCAQKAEPYVQAYIIATPE